MNELIFLRRALNRVRRVAGSKQFSQGLKLS